MLTLRQYAELVTREVRACLPDVKAMRSATYVRWTFGESVATLDTSDDRWCMVIVTDGPQPVRTYDGRHNVASAHIAASNIVGHFDPRWCRGIDVEPYPADVMNRFATGHQPRS